jgi:hypothetical protein
VTDTQQAKETGENSAVFALDRPITVRVAGADLLLSGRFNHWRPLAVSGWNDGTATAYLLFDATSTSDHAHGRRNPDLLSFASKSVERVSENAYHAKGTLRAEGVQRNVDAVIQTPSGHSPFFFMSVGLERKAFSGLWTELQVRASQQPANDAAAEMRPRSWLRVPDLGSA